jgi:hypothetical protein
MYTKPPHFVKETVDETLMIYQGFIGNALGQREVNRVLEMWDSICLTEPYCEILKHWWLKP